MEKIDRLTVFGFKGKTYFFDVHPLNGHYGDGAGVYVITRRDNAPNALHTIIHISSTASFKQIDNTFISACRDKYGANCICLLPVESEAERLAIEAELKDRYSTVS